MFQQMNQIESFIKNRRQLGIKPGLQRMEKLLNLLGRPQEKLTTIHIAGTNGKGSTAEFVKQGLIANNYQVGMFTSPSLTGLRGHVFLNDEPIPEHLILDIWSEIYPAILQLDDMELHPSEFEIITAIALFYFVDRTDIAIIEAGMGGREDTTNCILPILSIITNIAKDHTAFLGDTISEIASHKAGIIKSGTPVITGELCQEATEIVKKEATAKQAPIYRLGSNFTYHALQGNSITWMQSPAMPYDLTINMPGEHQKDNASIAMMALQLLTRAGFHLVISKVQSAFCRVKLIGRFEIVQNHPLIIVDGAHNPAGISRFLETMESNYKYMDRALLFAVFKDKDLENMLHQLQGRFTSITLTTFNHPRAASVTEMQQYGGEMIVEPNWQKAVNKMVNPNTVYFITGSLHFISFVRDYMNVNKR
ncbi:bifunctional folylpolyglutamate synthase/dihydrofolate synthase [Virgibacillus kapii]|uniref:tetrahydrofolate synthase n=1 Tax=Virgibacillus kapii TaxID=1638645 RepID=A0ABQ2D8C5_9BACI|nr:hypothetical protein M948_12330 [Virgibacillus sp. CM-4]MYL41622.1 bifunctional folylpolyglutamate synthase/dihydrofolate synthase [Virgibacillus massiliensis]GGJ49376.1 bifunctional folylpolyglutamate synthase/dihydrofolate synthase [Virgibacillus kapii]